jgi:hypothetical protein
VRKRNIREAEGRAEDCRRGSRGTSQRRADATDVCGDGEVINRLRSSRAAAATHVWLANGHHAADRAQRGWRANHCSVSTRAVSTRERTHLRCTAEIGGIRDARQPVQIGAFLVRS